jgi:acyl carrier protein
MKAAEISVLMAEILKVDQVGEQDNFFELGGNSLLSMALVSKINEESSVELTLIDLIYAPSAAGIAKVIEAGDPR